MPRFENFDKLPDERKDAVLDSALDAFARNDYAHASCADIAQGAGISKSLLFFYFKNKRELFCRTVMRLTRRMTEAVVDERFWEIDDFFELMDYAASRKSAALAVSPRALEFCLRLYRPAHKDIAGVLNGFIQGATQAICTTYLRNVRWDRFREDVEPERVVHMLVWMAEGYLVERQRSGEAFDLDAMLAEFRIWCELLKRATYKEEYL